MQIDPPGLVVRDGEGERGEFEMNEGDARVGDLTDRDHKGSCRCRRRRSTSRVITGVGKHRRRVGGGGGEGLEGPDLDPGPPQRALQD